MKYLELKIHASRQGIEQVTALLLQCGVDSISVDDPADMEDILNKKNEYGWDYIDEDLKEGLDREPTASVYFEDTPKNRELVQALKIQIMKLKNDELDGKFGWNVSFGRLYAEMVEVDDSQWKDKWKEFFKPTKITDRIVVKPSWENYEKKVDELVLEIDPGMAFGTGTHETTSLCMKLMERYMQRVGGISQRGSSQSAGGSSQSAGGASQSAGDLSQSVAKVQQTSEEKKILDVGCGSGILSIGAALLGAKDILGVEIDKDAVRVAKENVELNGVDSQVKIMQGDLMEGVDFKADIILANLMADLVMKLAPAAKKHLNQGGVFISSGILLEKEEVVSEALKEAGFNIIEVAKDGEWCAIVAG